MLSITPEDPASTAAAGLINALSETLARITGDSGKSSFDANDVRGTRALFVVARDAAGKPVGCGALRPLAATVAEIKRMYATPGTRGVGSAVLAHLEAAAKDMAYTELWLETRLVNLRAVSFYQHHGYSRMANFGKYVDNAEAICFSKALTPARAGA